MLSLNIENAKVILKKYLEKENPEKFKHSIRVAKTSKILAKKWNVSVPDAIIASLLHDIGRTFRRKEMLDFCSNNEDMMIYDFEVFDNLAALHGKISAYLFETEFENNNPERFNSISKAISSHVAGNVNMDDLAKIVFIADNVEPARSNEFLELIKKDKHSTPDEWIKRIITMKIEKSNRKKRAYNPFLDATYESLDIEK